MLTLCLVPVPSSQAQPDGASPEIIVRLSEQAPRALIAALAAPAGKKPTALVPLFQGVRATRAALEERPDREGPFRAYTLALTAADSLAAVRARWRQQPGVAYVQRNHTYTLDALDASYNDPLLDSLRHLSVIQARDAWEMTTGRENVTLGFVDTGLFFDHPDLAGQAWVNDAEIPANGVDDDGNGYTDDVHGYDFVDREASVEAGDYRRRDPDPSDDNTPGGGRGHGTSVAGVLAAALDNGAGIAGVAPGVRLLPLRAFGADGRGRDDDIAAAIVYAAQMNVDVLNLSFGDVYYSPLMKESIQYAAEQGTIVVASGGNDGSDDPHYPSDYTEALSVAWLNDEGTSLAGRGTRGVGLELGAPGSSVYTTLLPAPSAEQPVTDPEKLYGRRSGSSMAAPQVAGAAALLRSVAPDLTPDAVRSALTAAAVDIGTDGWDDRTGAGRLNVAAALMRALPGRVEIEQPAQNEGFAGEEVVVTGSALDPAFASYTVSFTGGDEGAESWQHIAGPDDQQAYQDTLARWSVADLPEGIYTLRLAVSLRTGRTIESRRRVFVDRSPPELRVRLLDDGLVGAHHGLLAEVVTDDLTDAEMEITLNGRTYVVTSDRQARRHGLTWADERGIGGRARVRLTTTNTAGRSTTREAVLNVPARQVNTAYLTDKKTRVPHGYLLPETTDFDADGLLEITFNRYEDGFPSDTLATWEWAGGRFARAHALAANLIPRDAGDTDGDERGELLASVPGATLLLEQPAPTSYPAKAAYVDTTGEPFRGARLADLDGDGRGEMLGHNGSGYAGEADTLSAQWRVLEYRDGGYEQAARLANPTSAASSELAGNAFTEPEALVADLDGDGNTDLLVGDIDGDWIIYEATGDDTYEVAWTHETERYSAGTRFAHGDFDGDGQPGFVTYAESFKGVRSDREQEPPFGLFYRWEARGDDRYALVDSLPVASGTRSNERALRAVDFAGNGRSALVVGHPPHLYVLRLTDAGWSLRYHRGTLGRQGEASGLRSRALVDADFDSDGHPELIAAMADGVLHRFVYSAAGGGAPPPRWTAARAVNDSTVLLQWQAPGTDSVTVYRGDPDGPVDRLTTTSADSLRLRAYERQRYVLRGWQSGAGSPLSAARRVRPHSPALVASARYPDARSVQLTFTEPLASDTRAAQFQLDAGPSPEALLLTQGGQAAILRFGQPPESPDTLRWRGVRDAGGTPVEQTAAAVAFPPAKDASLIVAAWEILDVSRVRLTFNRPLDETAASNAANYRLEPTGHVVQAAYDPASPKRVEVEVAGRALGPAGLQTTLRVVDMRSEGGQQLAPEGVALRLVEPARDLSAAYVFPNPYRASQHDGRLMIAGLPPEVDIRILSVDGTVVKTLEERDGDGGKAWDLTDESGRRVPSGLYLIRIETEGSRPVLRKAAIVR